MILETSEECAYLFFFQPVAIHHFHVTLTIGQYGDYMNETLVGVYLKTL